MRVVDELVGVADEGRVLVVGQHLGRLAAYRLGDAGVELLRCAERVLAAACPLARLPVVSMGSRRRTGSRGTCGRWTLLPPRRCGCRGR